MATYQTEISYAGGWHKDADLELFIQNRDQVVPQSGAPLTGTTVTWSGSAGNGSVTFFDDGKTFNGSAQFPNEGPVGYRGSLQ